MLLKWIQKEQKLFLLFSFLIIVVLVQYIILYNANLPYSSYNFIPEYQGELPHEI